jgi:cobalt-precorrin 5A hydrolase
MAHLEALRARRAAIGIGCRAGASASDIVDLVRRVMAQAEFADVDIHLASIDAKRNEPGLLEAARTLACPLAFFSREALAARAADAITRSIRVEALFNLPSVAETAALAGAGPGSRLVLARIAEHGVTCAIAVAASDIAA